MSDREIQKDGKSSSPIEKEGVMQNNQSRNLPRWMFLTLCIGGSWASGIYVGKITIEGVSSATLIPMIGFGVLSLLMAWGALADR